MRCWTDWKEISLMCVRSWVRSCAYNSHYMPGKRGTPFRPTEWGPGYTLTFEAPPQKADAVEADSNPSAAAGFPPFFFFITVFHCRKVVGHISPQKWSKNRASHKSRWVFLWLSCPWVITKEGSVLLRPVLSLPGWYQWSTMFPLDFKRKNSKMSLFLFQQWTGCNFSN